MKKSLSHLPEHKQLELREITGIILETASPEMIILFGSYARGTWVEDRFTDPEDHITYEYRSDYDICVITEEYVQAINHTLWDKVGGRIRASGIRTPFTIIAHDIREFNRMIGKKEYFFCDIKKEGIRLYDSKKFKIAPSGRLSMKERRKKAEEDFEYWYGSAVSFFTTFKSVRDREDFKQAAFQLHQATERYFAALLLVFTQYKPRTHDLEMLDRQVSTFDPRLCTVFPQSSEKERRLFNLLKKAYVDARYSRSYTITAEELSCLSARVEKLRLLTKDVCEKRIADLGRRSVRAGK